MILVVKTPFSDEREIEITKWLSGKMLYSFFLAGDTTLKTMYKTSIKLEFEPIKLYTDYIKNLNLKKLKIKNY